jgi:DNA-binding CsgD family transcriptional regulator
MSLIPPDATLERARMLEEHAARLMLRGRYSDADALASQAASAGRDHRDLELQVRATTTLGLTRAAMGHTDEGLELLRWARDSAKGPADVSRAVIDLSAVLDLSGRSREALQETRALLARASERPERSSFDAFLALQEINILLRLGMLDEAAAKMPEHVPGDATGSTGVYLQVLRLTLAVQRGDPSAADELEVARRLHLAHHHPQWISPLEGMAAALALGQGRIPEARAAAARGLAGLRHTEDALRTLELCWIALRVEAVAAERARAFGEEPDASAADALEEELDRALTIPTGWAESAAYAALARCELVRVRHALGGPAPEPATWEAAADSFEALELPWPAAYARLHAAEAHVLAGDRQAATEALGAACAAARTMGARPLLEEATALGRRARLRTEEPGAEPSTAPVDDTPEVARRLGLTPRELEVLLLVAEGRTNREIGSTLYMSEKTASVHVSRILAKLDVGGRVEAAAVAHRLGLTAETVS